MDVWGVMGLFHVHVKLTCARNRFLLRSHVIVIACAGEIIKRARILKGDPVE